MAHSLIPSLAEFTGGYVQVIKRDLKIAGRRRVYTLSWTGTGARNFLATVYPHLHFKQEEARVAMIFQDHMNVYKWRTQTMTEDELGALTAYRERLRLRVKNCKDLMLVGATNWNVGEVGGHPMPGLMGAEGQYRAKQEANELLGVCREHVPTAKAKMCSDLIRNDESATEMIALPRRRRPVLQVVE